ncbi:hypothetical protein ACWEQ4_01025 [Rhodococcus sp. NPDC003994]
MTAVTDAPARCIPECDCTTGDCNTDTVDFTVTVKPAPDPIAHHTANIASGARIIVDGLVAFTAVVRGTLPAMRAVAAAAAPPPPPFWAYDVTRSRRPRR